MADKEINKQSENKNLHRGNPAWGKGVSGNPAGRPKKKYCIPDILEKIGKEKTDSKIEKGLRKMFNIPKDKKLTNLDVVLYRIYSDALKGKPHAVQFLADRTEGKAIQSIEINAIKNEDLELIIGHTIQIIQLHVKDQDVLTKIADDLQVGIELLLEHNDEQT